MGLYGLGGVGYATRIEGKMDADLYVSIMEDELQESLHYYDKTPTDIIFQQDNDPKHTSRKAQNWFKDNGISVALDICTRQLLRRKFTLICTANVVLYVMSQSRPKPGC